ncbi:hypothetical protein NHH82_23850 [Oxalobacteraceae bacterium OTU3REALA1]|nr:hypothetical protein NHH82_23850 [Oxalobacteraceae bacterium OTU3REALA1]
MEWPFDLAPNVAAICTRQVIDENFPILRVVHYAGDDSWAFTCGTTSDLADIRIIGMGQALQLDPTIAEVASLAPGWGASRATIGGTWNEDELIAD